MHGASKQAGPADALGSFASQLADARAGGAAGDEVKGPKAADETGTAAASAALAPTGTGGDAAMAPTGARLDGAAAASRQESPGATAQAASTRRPPRLAAVSGPAGALPAGTPGGAAPGGVGGPEGLQGEASSTVGGHPAAADGSHPLDGRPGIRAAGDSSQAGRPAVFAGANRSSLADAATSSTRPAGEANASSATDAEGARAERAARPTQRAEGTASTADAAPERAVTLQQPPLDAAASSDASTSDAGHAAGRVTDRRGELSSSASVARGPKGGSHASVRDAEAGRAEQTRSRWEDAIAATPRPEGADAGAAPARQQATPATDPTTPAAAVNSRTPEAVAAPATDATAPTSASGTYGEARLTPHPGSPQFAPALGQQLQVFVRDGIQHARLHLNPDEMGPISVRISVDGDAAQIVLTAELATTRQALEQAMPVLASSLREEGLTLTGGGVFEQPRDPGRQAASSGDGTRSRTGGEPAPAGIDAAPAEVRAAPRRALGALDVYA